MIFFIKLLLNELIDVCLGWSQPRQASSTASRPYAAPRRHESRPPRARILQRFPNADWKRFTDNNFLVYYTLERLRAPATSPTVVVSDLLEMPVDIMIAVCEQLHPVDLLHLCGASKHLQAWLSSSTFAAAWKSAYRNYPDIPESPDDLSPYKWTYLLFGPSTCYDCDSEEIVMADFILRARLCTRCLIRRTAYLDQSFGLPPGIQVPRTFRREGTQIDAPTYYRARVSRHLLAEIRQVVQENDQVAVWNHKAQEMEDLSQRCIKWVSDIRRDLDNSTAIDELCQRVIDNMIHLGYTPVTYSIRAALEEWSTLHVGNVFPITFKWDTMVPLIIKKNVTWNSDRNAVNSKAQQIFNAVMRYKRETPPSKWQSYPMHHCPPLANYSWVIYNPTNSFSWLPFRDLMYRKQFQSTEAFDLAVECVEEWRRTVQGELLTLCTNPELAIAVFALSTVRKRRAFIGMSEALCGWSCGALLPEDAGSYWELEERGQAAAKSLVMVAGLDPSTLLAIEFDKVSDDLRFVCLDCSSSCRASREARNWRDSQLNMVEVHHFIMAKPETHSTPHWGLATPQSLPFIKEHESWTHVQAWSCNHCTAHIHNHVFRRTLLQHIWAMHQIHKPVFGVDYIRLLAPDPFLTQGTRVFNSPVLYFCSFCPAILSLDALKAHQKEK
ncbi:hypothetical protein C8J56DRAFT_1054163 [Mycena floridula]|nr:hypothetical protein C8J56DRAFT_1054163 [Mycena floridula]